MGPKSQLEAAIQKYPSLVAFARAVGVSRATVYSWMQSCVSIEGAVAIQRVTGLDPHLLRPDAFQSRGKPAAARKRRAA